MLRLVLVGLMLAAGARQSRALVGTGPLPVPRGPARDPGARSLADFLSAFVSTADPGTVVVLNDDGHLASLLAELPAELPRILILDRRVVDARVEYQLYHLENSIFVAASNGSYADVLSIPPLFFAPLSARVLIWLHAPVVPAEFRLRKNNRKRYCPPQYAALLVSTPNNTGAVYRLRNQCALRSSAMVAEQVDRWESRFDWRNHELAFPRYCRGWRRQTTLPLLLFVVTSATRVAAGRTAELLEHALDLPVQVDLLDVHTDGAFRITRKREQCRLDGCVSFRPMLAVPGPNVVYEVLERCSVVVFVPVGSGVRPNLLQAVTVEFTRGMWIMTVLAMLSVAATVTLGTAALDGRPTVAGFSGALLHALAPLLAQSPPGRPAQRPLAAAWLTMCVVITGAYQGLLLSELTAPAQEINSLEQLERSGLDVFLDLDLVVTEMQSFLPATLQSRSSLISLYQMSKLREVFQRRNSAVISDYDVHTKLHLAPLLESRHFRMFRLPFSRVKAHFAFTKGSPMIEPVRRAVGKLKAAGLVQFRGEMLSYDDLETSRSVSDPELRPLKLADLGPAFILLGFGLCLSGFCFAFEVLCHKALKKKHPRIQFSN
ncbi:Glutamate receptor 3.2 [Frankliniella fusca]|uniref:Glutamate receptor 3.2 n=1 Tax=Frankliniella fusca TaxID=407009 RepID=A0AAE1H3G5_9NEOP|nr:Glutamate receptor 3.2 [Frankliniella fusca]